MCFISKESHELIKPKLIYFIFIYKYDAYSVAESVGGFFCLLLKPSIFYFFITI